MVCDLFVRSYWKDFAWLGYALRSIERYCTGFRRTLVVVPESSRRRLSRLEMPGGRLEVRICPDYPNDYLGQQVTKVYADSLTDAEYVCHIDSDCLFVSPCAPEDLVRDGRPTIAVRRGSPTIPSSGQAWSSYSLMSCGPPWHSSARPPISAADVDRWPTAFSRSRNSS